MSDFKMVYTGKMLRFYACYALEPSGSDLRHVKRCMPNQRNSSPTNIRNINRIVHTKTENLLNINSPIQAIQDADEFVSSSKQIWRNVA